MRGVALEVGNIVHVCEDEQGLSADEIIIVEEEVCEALVNGLIDDKVFEQDHKKRKAFMDPKVATSSSENLLKSCFFTKVVWESKVFNTLVLPER